MSIPVVTPDPVPIEVYDVGELKAPDIVEVDADEDKQLLVEGVSADNKLLVTNISGVQLDLVVGDRLVPTTDLPEIFADPLGTVPSSNPFSTNPQTGRAGRYIRNRRFDYSVAGSDFPTRLYMDAEGGRPSSWINATEFSSIQAAIDAAEPGAVILIPSGLYSENLLINKKLTLQGDQIGENPFVATGQAGTVLTPTGPNNHAITIVSPAGLVQVRNLRIQGDDVPGSGDGIHIVGNSESE
jgi:hypothetical protein